MRFRELDGTVDVVVCNPPYIPLDAWESVAPEARDHDPALALWSGDDGLDAMRVVERDRAPGCCVPAASSAPSTPTPRASPRRRCSRAPAAGPTSATTPTSPAAPATSLHASRGGWHDDADVTPRFDDRDETAARGGLCGRGHSPYARGELVVLPTDTVYGVGRDAFDRRRGQPAARRQGPRPRHAAARCSSPRRPRSTRSRPTYPTWARAWSTSSGPVRSRSCATQQAVAAVGPRRHPRHRRRADARTHDVALELLQRTGPLAVSRANTTGLPAGDRRRRGDRDARRRRGRGPRRRPVRRRPRLARSSTAPATGCASCARVHCRRSRVAPGAGRDRPRRPRTRMPEPVEEPEPEPTPDDEDVQPACVSTSSSSWSPRAVTLPAVRRSPASSRIALGRGGPGPRPRRARHPDPRTSAASRCSAASSAALPRRPAPAVPVAGRRPRSSTTPASCSSAARSSAWSAWSTTCSSSTRSPSCGGQIARRRLPGASTACSSTPCRSPAPVQFGLDPAQGALFTILLVVGTVNAVNFVDGLDGLAGGHGRDRRGRVLRLLLRARGTTTARRCAIAAALLCAALGRRVRSASCRTTSSRPGSSSATPARC